MRCLVLFADLFVNGDQVAGGRTADNTDTLIFMLKPYIQNISDMYKSSKNISSFSRKQSLF